MLKSTNQKLKKDFQICYDFLSNLIEDKSLPAKKFDKLLSENLYENHSEQTQPIDETPVKQKRGRKPSIKIPNQKSSKSNTPNSIFKDSPSITTKKETKNLPKQHKTTKNSDIIEQLVDLDAACTTCNLKTNAHLLVKCDTCQKYYHINCLDPPLEIVPKKTKLYGW
jgi:hypothetical protein